MSATTLLIIWGAFSTVCAFGVLAVIALEERMAARADAEFPEIAKWEAEKDAAWDEHVLQAVALNESPLPFDSPVKDRIAAQIAANRAQFLDAEWLEWNNNGGDAA